MLQFPMDKKVTKFQLESVLGKVPLKLLLPAGSCIVVDNLVVN